MNKLERKECVIKVARRMLGVHIDEIISIQQLSAAAGQDLVENRWVISAALRAVNAEYGAVFATVRGEGYRRLANSEGALFSGNRGLLRVRRASRAAMRFSTNAAKHANDMTADQRRRHNQQMSTLGLVAHLTLQRSVETQPEEAPPERADPLSGLRRALGF